MSSLTRWDPRIGNPKAVAGGVPRAFTRGRLIEAIRSIGIVARRVYASWRSARDARATYYTLRELDDRTLRDLGFDRSELTSIAAEASGRAERTRSRLAPGGLW